MGQVLKYGVGRDAVGGLLHINIFGGLRTFWQFDSCGGGPLDKERINRFKPYPEKRARPLMQGCANKIGELDQRCGLPLGNVSTSSEAISGGLYFYYLLYRYKSRMFR